MATSVSFSARTSAVSVAFFSSSFSSLSTSVRLSCVKFTSCFCIAANAWGSAPAPDAAVGPDLDAPVWDCIIASLSPGRPAVEPGPSPSALSGSLYTGRQDSSGPSLCDGDGAIAVLAPLLDVFRADSSPDAAAACACLPVAASRVGGFPDRGNGIRGLELAREDISAAPLGTGSPSPTCRMPPQEHST